MIGNRWTWLSIGLAIALQLLVLYAPPLQRAFGTVALSAADWLRCAAAASTVLWVREASKIVAGMLNRR